VINASRAEDEQTRMRKPPAGRARSRSAPPGSSARPSVSTPLCTGEKTA
jgi:hypothetical protein